MTDYSSHSNRILAIINEKARKAKDPQVIPFYKRKLKMLTNRSSKNINDLLNNREQPEDREKPAIAKTLMVNIEQVFPEKVEDNQPQDSEEAYSKQNRE